MDSHSSERFYRVIWSIIAVSLALNAAYDAVSLMYLLD